jgi:ankyrin repeat protein
LNRPADSGHTPITAAINGNHTEAAKELLSFPGVEVNAVRPSDSRAPLHHAVSSGNAELVERLIEHGADLQIRDSVNGFTALDFARYFNERKTLDLLKDNDPENGVGSG